MPNPFRLPRPIRPEFPNVPAELTAEQRIAEVDRQLLAIALIPNILRTPDQWSSLNVLLDRRNMLHQHGVILRPSLPGMPQVPVIPGRTS